MQIINISIILYALCLSNSFAWPTGYLFTRTNPINYIKVTGSLENTPFVKARNTKIIIHGFGGSANDELFKDMDEFLQMKNEFLTKEDANVIIVDWVAGAASPNYGNAAANAKSCADELTQFLIANQVDRSKIHCIGFSLGAHVCGFIGKQMKLKRITGLDPAGPVFKDAATSGRLDKSDADFVDVINTNGVFGIYQSLGHKNFYPNGSPLQPGCLFKNALWEIKTTDEKVVNLAGCSHIRARTYFIESINSSCKFNAFACANYDKFTKGRCTKCSSTFGCSTMGYDADSNKEEGTYYLDTNNRKPFCKN